MIEYIHAVEVLTNALKVRNGAPVSKNQLSSQEFVDMTLPTRRLIDETIFALVSKIKNEISTEDAELSSLLPDSEEPVSVID